jgi:hypothetical protein
MDDIKTGKMEITDCTVDFSDSIAKWDALSQEERDRRTAQIDLMMKDRKEQWEIRDAEELKINLRILRDLLDFNTYRYFRFEFEERQQFSLKHIVDLINVYKINNNI